jgi:predicted TPR repeat methyltransferase
MSSTPPASPPPEFTKRLAEAQDAIRTANHARLIEIGGEVGFMTPQLGVGPFLVGLGQSGIGHFANARAAFQHAVRIEPMKPDFLFHLSYTEMELDLLDSALDGFQRVLKLKPNDDKAHANIGAIYARRGDRAQSVAAYERALGINPANYAALNAIGEFALAEANFQTALEATQRAIAVDPTQANPHYVRAMTLELIGKVDEAIASAKEAWTRNDKLAPVATKLSTLHARQNNMVEAQAWVLRAKALTPDDPGVLMAEAIAFDRPLDQLPESIVKGIFNTYASAYDRHLSSGLQFRAPQLAMEQVSVWANAQKIANASLDVVDLGCGTGLFGEQIKPLAKHLIGVDIAQAMLDEAGRRSLYHELVCSELHAYVESAPVKTIDVAVAADVLVYIGALERLFLGVKSMLKTGGIFVFGVETPTDGATKFMLKPSGRYQHATAYVETAARDAGFTVDVVAPCELRVEGGVPVMGVTVRLVAP